MNAQEGWRHRLREMMPLDWALLRHIGAEPVPYHLKKWWFCLGGTVLYLFVVQVVTGIALTFYYVHSPDEDYASVAAITREVRFGWFIRSLHKWSAQFMIVALILAARVFYRRLSSTPSAQLVYRLPAVGNNPDFWFYRVFVGL